MPSSTGVSRWLTPSLVGVFVVALVPILLLFARFSDHDRPSRLLGNSRDQNIVAPGVPGGMMRNAPEIFVGERRAGVPETPMMQKGVMAPVPTASISATPTEARQIALSASLTLRVRDIDKTVAQIRSFVSTTGGFVENSNIDQPKYGTRTAWMTAKIPAADFQKTFDELKQNLTFIVGENSGSVDLTAAFVDLGARLNNKQAEERTLQTLFDRATKVSDVIEVTDRLTTVRSEIESLQAELRLLESQTSMATITVSMTEDPRAVIDSGEFRSGNVWKQAWNELARSLATMGGGLILLLVAGVPVVLVYLLVLWGIYALARKGVRKLLDR